MANELKMEVILQAIDQATRPIRAITQGSVGLSRQLKASREALKGLQEQQGKIDSFKRMQEALAGNSRELTEARQKLKSYQNGVEAQRATNEAIAARVNVHRAAVRRLHKELMKAKEPSAALTQQYTLAQTELQKLEKTYKSSQNHLRRLKQSMQDAGADVTKLETKHKGLSDSLSAAQADLSRAGIRVDRLGDEEAELARRIQETTTALERQKGSLAAVARQQERLAAAKSQYEKTQALAGSMAGVGAGAAAAGAAMGMPVLSVVKDYMSFEDAMAGVAKQVEGARDDNGQLTRTYYEMADAIKAMADRIPMATTELAALVEGGARMGIQGKENLLTFAEVAANAATAFELPASQIGEDLARIANLYKLPIRQIDQLGDAINYLDDNAQSKGADIIDVLQRTAGVTASVGMSFKDAAALGSTFLTLGASAEVAATATNAMIRELAIATQQPKRFQKGLEAIGMQAEAIQSSMATDSTGTILKVLEAINRLPKDAQLTATTQLFGKEYGDDAAKLAANIDEYRRQLELANSAAGEGSMQREADIRAELLSARLQMAQNQAFNLSSALGETLRPTILELVQSFNSVVGRVNAWVKANPELAGQILKTVAGVAALAAGFGAVTLAMASFLGPFAMARYALTVFGIKGAGLLPVLFKLGKVALPMVAQAILWIGRALLMNPIGLAVTAIAGAAYLIYKNWDRVGPYFLGLWAEIKAGFNGGLGGIAKLILDFSPLGLFYRAFAGVMSYFGVEMPAKFSDFGGMLLDGLVTGIKTRLGAVKDAIRSVGDSAVGWFKEKLGIHSPSRVFAQLGGFAMQGLEQGLVGGQGGPLGAVTAMAKQLAAAGAVTFGLSSPAIAMDNRPPLSAAAGGAPVVVQGDTYQITIQAAPGTDTAALRQMLNQLLDERERSKAARVRSALRDQE